MEHFTELVGGELYPEFRIEQYPEYFSKKPYNNTEQLLRLIQSIPSPKAEPFKIWLAMVGRERIEETT